MSIVLVVFLTIISGISSLDDLTPAAITVYRNPDFFQHLSAEFNNHLKFYSKDPHYQGPYDEYQSPTISDAHSFPLNYNQQYKQVEDSYNQVNGDGENSQSQHEEQEYNGDEKEYEEDEDGSPSQSYSNDDENQETYNHAGEEEEESYHPVVKENNDRPKEPVFTPPPRVRPHPPKRGRVPPQYGEETRTKPEKTETRKLKGYDQPLQKLQVYHQGRKYPIDAEETQEHEYSPIKMSHKHHPQHSYDDHQYHDEPSYPYDTEEFISVNTRKPTKFGEEVKETKKGTREYLKHNQLSENHELKDQSTQKKRLKPNTRYPQSSKRPRKYVAYRVQPVPVYSHYRVVPVRYRPVYYTRAYKRSTTKRKPKVVEDDSAYVINSDLDQDYQKFFRSRNHTPG